jgi:hypothetical protein
LRLRHRVVTAIGISIVTRVHRNPATFGTAGAGMATE